jgi:hypothetical protein
MGDINLIFRLKAATRYSSDVMSCLFLPPFTNCHFQFFPFAPGASVRWVALSAGA